MWTVLPGFLGVLLVVATSTWGQVSIGSLRSSAESSNLEAVTLLQAWSLCRVRASTNN